MEREEKKALFEEKKKRGIVPLLALVLLLLAAAGAGAWFLGSSNSVIQAANGQVSIPLAEVKDGKAHFYTFRSGGTDIRFFVLQSHDGVIRAALDTCDVCYREKKGYRQEGDMMVCNNCDQKFRSDQINEVRGGCNPAPIERNIVGDRLVIAETELVAGARYFQ